jgi:hypothetical protein
MEKSGINKVLIGFIAVIVTILCIPIAMDLRNPISVDAATEYLEDQNYVVFSAEEYALLAKEATAYAAVQNANAAAEAAVDAAEAAADAVVAAQAAVAKVDLFNSAVVYLYPENATGVVTLLCGSSPDRGYGTWTEWTEVKDNNNVTLSSVFATESGYIGDIAILYTSALENVYVIELSWGANYTDLARFMFVSTASEYPGAVSQIKSRRVPAGQKVYYRAMCEADDSATIRVGFRYFYE